MTKIRAHVALNGRRVAGAITLGLAVSLAVTEGTSAAERDLYAGLAYLRAGAQSQAMDSLTRYRDDERDAEVRQSVSRVLPLLKHPLTVDVREYLASTIENSVGARTKMRVENRRPNYWSRVFPVFP